MDNLKIGQCVIKNQPASEKAAGLQNETEIGVVVEIYDRHNVFVSWATHGSCEKTGQLILSSVIPTIPSTKFKIGDLVVKNPLTWKSNDFDGWGRGIGIGIVVIAPFEIEEDEVDVRWPAGRCFENVTGILPASDSKN